MKTQNKYIQITVILAVLAASFFPITAEAYSNGKITSQEEIDTAIIEGFDYIASQVNPDGGIPWIDETSSVATTIRVVQALAAAGYPQDFIISESGNRPIDFLESEGWEWVIQTEAETPGFSTARAGQLLTAVAAANKNPRAIGKGSSDLVYEIKYRFDQNSGIFGESSGENVLDQVWAMIGLAANNASVPLAAADWLASAQGEDGSWNDGFGSYLDTTPLAVMALLGSGHYGIESPSIKSALNFIKQNQQEDGGWQNQWDTTTNPNTTGVILQAISSMGQFPTDETWHQPEGNPLSALSETQQENGVFGGEFRNAYSTADAIIGLTGRNTISLGFLESASKAFDYLFEIQGSAGGWGNVGQTLDVVMALNAAGWQPKSVIRDGSSPLDFVSENLSAYLEAGPDAIGKSILGITAAGLDPRNFNGVDLASRLIESYDETALAFGSPQNSWHQAFGILGLFSAGMEIPQGASETLLGLQKDDGGWEYSTGIGTSPDSTALAIQALVASGFTVEDQKIINALDYLHETQSAHGGWGDSSTTSFAIMAINALGQTSDMWPSDSGKTPVENLMTYQKANGPFFYSQEFNDDSVMSTASSLLALFGGDYLFDVNETAAENYAAIVVDPGSGEVQTSCVSFNEDSITGLDLLEMSGFNYTLDQDGFITSLVDTSNQEGETNYWSYWYWDGREWQFHSTGAANTVVAPGSVEAWHFTSWELFPSLPLKYIPDIDDICEVKILADFSQQPHISYNDLVPFALQEPVEIEATSEEPNEEVTAAPTIESIPEGTARIQSTPTIDEDQIDEQERTGSRFAIILIAAAGLITILIMIILYLRRRK